MDMETMKTRLDCSQSARRSPARECAAPCDAPGSGFSAMACTRWWRDSKPTASSTRRPIRQTNVTSVYKADVYTGQIRKLVDLPAHAQDRLHQRRRNSRRGHISTRAKPAGRRTTGQNAPPRCNAPAPQSTGGGDNRVASPEQGPHYQPLDKGEMMERRLAARLPLLLFTIRLEPGPNGEKPGDIKVLLHSTDWVNHLLFSPTDPELLMYCHEGPWQKVDRIWMIHTDGTHNTMIHKRTMVNEIFGPRVLGAGRRNDLVRLAVSQRRGLFPGRLQPEDRAAHRVPPAAR